MKNQRWNERTYKALYDWLDGTRQKSVEKILLEHGLTKEVARLRRSKTLGTWYQLTQEAAQSIGFHAVALSAYKAQAELDAMIRN